MYLRCEKLHVLSTRDATGKVQQVMKAETKAMVQSAEFFGSANSITFDEAKQQVIFEGSPGSPAVLNQVVARGQEPKTFKARKFIYYRQSGDFDSEEMIGGSSGSPSGR